MIEELTAAMLRGLDLLDELDVVLSKQARIGGDGGRRSAGNPLPYSILASDLRYRLEMVLTRCGLGGLLAGYEPLSGLETVRRLRSTAGVLSAAPTAAERLSELLETCELAERAIDRPEPETYLGVCWAWTTDGRQCPADLYVSGTAPTVTCGYCGTGHDVAARRDWLLDLAEDELRYASELARALSGLGVLVDASRIRKWAFRGRIISHGRDHRDRPLYRVGDVLDALQAELAEKRESA